MANDRIVLIDAFSQIFRAFYAVRELTDASGRPVNALYVFTKLLMEIDRDYPSSSGALFFDSGKVEFRLKLKPDYKANRPPMPDALRSQIPLIEEMSTAFGWKSYRYPGYEADDLIGCVVEKFHDREIGIVTSDKDLSQLVTERVSLISPAHGRPGFECRGPAEVKLRFGVDPSRIVDYLAIVGDTSDNIDGVPGVGPKGAAKFIELCGGIDRYLSDPSILADTSLAKKFEGKECLLKRNLELVSLRTDVPECLSNGEAALVRSPVDYDAVRGMCERYGFRSILKDLPETARKAPVDEKSGGELFEQGDLF